MPISSTEDIRNSRRQDNITENSLELKSVSARVIGKGSISSAYRIRDYKKPILVKK